MVEEAAPFQLAGPRRPYRRPRPQSRTPIGRDTRPRPAGGTGEGELGHRLGPERLTSGVSVRLRRHVVTRAETGPRCAKLGAAVTELARAHCEACAPGTPPLPEEEAAALLSEIPDWERDGIRSLRREFSFPDFRDAFGFVARAALIAEAEGHHPASSWVGAAHFIGAHDPRRLRPDAKRLRTRGEDR